MRIPCMICGHWLTASPYVYLMIGKTCLAKSQVAMGSNNSILTEIYKLKCGSIVKKEVDLFVSLYQTPQAIDQFKVDYKKDIETISQNQRDIVNIIKVQQEIEEYETRKENAYKVGGQVILIASLDRMIQSCKLRMGTSLEASSWVSPLFKTK